MSYTRRIAWNFGPSYAGNLADAGYALDGDTAWSPATEKLDPDGDPTGGVVATATFPDGYAGLLLWCPDTTAAPKKYAFVVVNPGDDERADSIYARLGAPAGASLAADVAAVKADTAPLGALNDAMALGEILDPNPTTKTFVIQLDLDADVPDKANYVGLWLCFRTGPLFPAKQAITAYRKLTAKTALITVAIPFEAAPTSGDLISII